MPRKKLDPAAEILAYFTDTNYAVACVVLGLVKAVMAKRAPAAAVVKVRRKRQAKPVVAEPAFSQAHGMTQRDAEAQPAPTVAKPKQTRKRRLSADSPRPANEATPIVPLQDEVGDETYTGN